MQDTIEFSEKLGELTPWQVPIWLIEFKIETFLNQFNISAKAFFFQKVVDKYSL